MELYKEILLKAITQQIYKVILSPEFSANEIIDSICYKTLLKIKEIIEDDAFDDSKCYIKIEKIVCLFEDIGSNGGNRHNFK